MKWMLEQGVSHLEIALLPIPDEPGCFNVVLSTIDQDIPVTQSQGLYRPDELVGKERIKESYIREALDQ